MNMAALTRKKEEIVKKAEDLGKEYEAKYKGCGQCTFLATIDALRWGGLEIIPRDMEDRFFPGVTALTAGVCTTGNGTCGAVASSALAIGMALGSTREMQEKDGKTMALGFDAIQRCILDKYYDEYHSILCKDVQRKYFGKAWNLTDPDMRDEFLGITKGCVIMKTAMMTVECILEEFEKGNVKSR
jgi:hypothetical protein